EKSDIWLSRKHVEKWAPWYYGNQNPKLPYISPLYGDFESCPEIFFLVGNQEILLDDSVRLFEKIKRQDGKADLFVAKNMQHDWLISLPWLAESKTAFAKLIEFIV